MMALILAFAIVAEPVSDAPVLPTATRQADGRLLLSKEAEAAIDLRIKQCQADKETAANAKPISPVTAALTGLGIGLAVGLVVGGVVAGVAVAAAKSQP